MQIDFSAVIMEIDGKTPVMLPDGTGVDANGKPKMKPATLGLVTCSALLAPYADEQNLAQEEKVKRFGLAQTVVDGGIQEISIDDAALLKKLINKGWPQPLIVARAFDIIERKPKAVAKPVEQLEKPEEAVVA